MRMDSAPLMSQRQYGQVRPADFCWKVTLLCLLKRMLWNTLDFSENANATVVDDVPVSLLQTCVSQVGTKLNYNI